MSSKSVIVIGGGLAGLSCAVALAEAGFSVRLFERRPFLGGRAASYDLPNGEHVDNCQHVTLGCCTNLADFYARAGAAGKIAYYDRLIFADAHGHRAVMQSSPLPAPLHLAPSLALYPFLTWSERHSIGHAMMAIFAGRRRNDSNEGRGETMLGWLQRHKQSAAAINRFWRVVLVSALNEELDRTEAHYGLDVFWKAFLANRTGYLLGIPGVPLGELYDGCGAAIKRMGGDVRLRSSVRSLHLSGEGVTGLLMDGDSVEAADYYVMAVPYQVFGELIPPSLKEQPIYAGLQRLRASPITSVHFWFDGDVMAEPFLAAVDTTTQWIFNKTRLYAGAGGRYLQVVISASYDLMGRSRQEIIEICQAELHNLVPATSDAHVVKATVVKEAAATFSPEVGCDKWRPPQRTSLSNLYLAGDWTQTGWPATMEGAVRSGYLSAEAVLEDSGFPRKLLRPDLPVEGLARL